MYTFQIDKNKPIPELELSLHKPNEEQVGSLTDSYNRSGKFSYGRYNELELTIPKYVERKHKQIPYKEFDLIRDKYLVKATYGGLFSEYLVVTKMHKSKNGMPTKQVTLKSRQYELNGKTIRNLEALSYTVREIMELGLEGTNWTIGEIDTDLELIINEDGYVDDPDKVIPRRSFDETKITSLKLLYKIAETFEVILQFDTFARTVSVYKPEKAEIDKGLTASYGKYIKSLDEDIDGENTTTRLYVYGKDNLTINEVNPTGQAYIEDYSYYMQGYETDESGNAISHSPYMSDSLCQAIIDFNLKLIEEEFAFKNYLDELEPIQNDWADRLSELYTLEYDLEIILDNLDIAKASEEPTTELKRQRTDKEKEIDNKQSEIDELETKMQMVENDIQDLREYLSLENNFTPEQVKERNNFIVDGEWSNGNYFDVEELYEKGKEVMKKMREPTRDLDLSLVQFLESVESQRDWDRIGLGYVIHTHYEPLDIEFNALITEMNIGFDDKTMGISISNVDYKSNKLQFLEMLYSTAVSTANRVQNNGKDWSDNIDRTDYLAEFLENPWDTARQRIISGVDEVVNIGRRGITITNPRFPNEMVIQTAGVIALSLDSGENWSTAISPYGVVAERLIGKILLAKEKLIVGDEEGTFNIEGNLLTIKDRNEVVRLRLGEYTSNKFGLQLMNKSGKDVVLDENGILQTWQEGRADNVDMSHGITLYVYLPKETLSVRHGLLNFRLLPFRSYSGTTKAGGSTVRTTSGGGGVSKSTASGGGTSKSTASGGATTESSAAGGDHRHLVFLHSSDSTSQFDKYRYYARSAPVGGFNVALDIETTTPADLYTAGSSGNHTHSISIPNHTHSFTVPAHAHDFEIPNHDHSVSIPVHSHEIAHGIYTDTFARGVGIIINGIDRTAEFGGKFDVSQANIEIGHHLKTGQWNEIELTSDSLGRIDASVFVQAFMGT